MKLSKKITVITDHQALVTLMIVKQDDQMLDNWLMKLSEIQFVVIYRKVADNVVANCLSRCHRSAGQTADGEHQHRGEGGDVGQPT